MRQLLILFLFIAHQSGAWIYPEHRRIALLAIQKLSPERRAILDRLWLEGRAGFTNRLSESIIEPDQGMEPTHLDYASWAAISGDHSCSPDDMLKIVLKSDWIMKVADIAAKLQIKIEQSKSRSQHINAIRDSDIRLQRVDPEYATRAGSNNVHFLLARAKVDTDPAEYLKSCLAPGAELNALGAYSWFHMSAMFKAARYAHESLTPEEKSALILSALADEAFALHFLEDVYASGHTAGTWGAASVRKGTHDFYNEKGLEIVTWDGRRMISLGDAFMRPVDADFAAENVRLSLEQLIKAASGEWSLDYVGDNISSVNNPDTLNVCENNYMFPRMRNEAASEGKIRVQDFLRDVLIKTPVPGLATGLGEIPRFRSELGMFIGLSSALNYTSVNGGFGVNQTHLGGVGGIEANARFGFGLDGVLNQAGDGLVFLQLGLVQDASSTNKFDYSNAAIPPGAIPAAIPGRPGYNVRLRLPFWLIPGDLLIAGPILALTSPKTMAKMAVAAGNGGAIPWQSGIATPIGRFQFVLGREVGVTFYTRRENGILVSTPGGSTQLLSYSSTKFDFPIIEFRPFRTFSIDQTSSLMVQLTAGFDIPHGESVILPVGSTTPELKTVWNVGARIIFDWRRYF